MDVQRSNKRGKANYFVVIPVTHEDIKNNLREVHAHLEAKYPSARAELRRVCTNHICVPISFFFFVVCVLVCVLYQEDIYI